MTQPTTLEPYLAELIAFVRSIQNLPDELRKRSRLPSGSRDESEAALLHEALVELNAVSDGSTDSRSSVLRLEFQDGLKMGAAVAGDAFGELVQTIQDRIFGLAQNGVRPPDSLLSQELHFPPRVEFYYPDHVVPKTAFNSSDGEQKAIPFIFVPFDDIPADHPARIWVSNDQLYEHDYQNGKVKGLVLGLPRGAGRFIPPYHLRSTTVQWTRRMSAPQVQARMEYQRQEEAQRLEATWARENRKTPEHRALETRVAQMEEELALLKQKSQAK